MGTWIKKLVSCISQAFNALILGGNQDESFSARSYREQWWTEKYIDKLFFWEDNHCRNAHLYDIERAEWMLKNRRTK